MALAVGASCLLFALWDLSDQSFGSSRSRGGLFGGFAELSPAWLFDAFGHWGPRVVLIAMGIVFTAGSFWLASLARENDGDDQRSGTKRSAILSWTLILLVLLLLAFIVVGPLFRSPTIDRALSYWHQSYLPALTAFLALTVVIGLTLRWNWEDFRETGDPWNLLRPAFYLMAVIVVVVFLSWEAIVGTG
jgi:cytochrome bd-type quinol oxidase subunit 2